MLYTLAYLAIAYLPHPPKILQYYPERERLRGFCQLNGLWQLGRRTYSSVTTSPLFRETI